MSWAAVGTLTLSDTLCLVRLARRLLSRQLSAATLRVSECCWKRGPRRTYGFSRGALCAASATPSVSVFPYPGVRAFAPLMNSCNVGARVPCVVPLAHRAARRSGIRWPNATARGGQRGPLGVHSAAHRTRNPEDSAEWHCACAGSQNSPGRCRRLRCRPEPSHGLRRSRAGG